MHLSCHYDYADLRPSRSVIQSTLSAALIIRYTRGNLGASIAIPADCHTSVLPMTRHSGHNREITEGPLAMAILESTVKKVGMR